MTEEFEFETPQITMKICGKEYSVTADAHTASVCRDILEEAKSRLARVKEGDMAAETSEMGICNFFKKGIEQLMFPGAVDRIFDKRKQNLSDMAELLCFVVARIRDGYMKAEK